MKRFPFLILFLIPFFSFSKSKPVQVQPAKTDLIEAWKPSDIQIHGYLGEKIDLCISQRIKKQDVQHLIEPFKTRNETRLWQTEFWGKWILSAIASYEYNHDPEMLTIIQGAVSGLLATQTPDGYISNYSKDAQLQHWDIWGRKYTCSGCWPITTFQPTPKFWMLRRS